MPGKAVTKGQNYLINKDVTSLWGHSGLGGGMLWLPYSLGQVRGGCEHSDPRQGLGGYGGQHPVRPDTPGQAPTIPPPPHHPPSLPCSPGTGQGPRWQQNQWLLLVVEAAPGADVPGGEGDAAGERGDIP